MKIAVDAISGMTAEAEIGQDLSRQGCHHQGIRRVRRIPARQGRPGSHQRTRQLPRQEDRGHRESRRRHHREMPRRGRKRPRASFAQGRDGRARQGNGRGEKGRRSGGALIAICIQGAGGQPSAPFLFAATPRHRRWPRRLRRIFSHQPAKPPGQLATRSPPTSLCAEASRPPAARLGNAH